MLRAEHDRHERVGLLTDRDRQRGDEAGAGLVGRAGLEAADALHVEHEGVGVVGLEVQLFKFAHLLRGDLGDLREVIEDILAEPEEVHRAHLVLQLGVHAAGAAAVGGQAARRVVVREAQPELGGALVHHGHEALRVPGDMLGQRLRGLVARGQQHGPDELHERVARLGAHADRPVLRAGDARGLRRDDHRVIGMDLPGLERLGHEQIGHELAEAGHGSRTAGGDREEHLARGGVADQHAVEHLKVALVRQRRHVGREAAVGMEAEHAVLVFRAHVEHELHVGQAHIEFVAAAEGVVAALSIVNKQLVAREGEAHGVGVGAVGAPGVGRRALPRRDAEGVGAGVQDDAEGLARVPEQHGQIRQRQIQAAGIGVLIGAHRAVGPVDPDGEIEGRGRAGRQRAPCEGQQQEEAEQESRQRAQRLHGLTAFHEIDPIILDALTFRKTCSKVRFIGQPTRYPEGTKGKQGGAA